MDNPLVAMQQVFRSLAQHFRDAVMADPHASGWSSAGMDVRFSSDGTSWARNTWAHVAGASVSLDVLSGTTNELLKDIWQSRAGEPFYGFILSINPQGEVEIRLNYDIDCLADPTFWTS